ARRDLGPRLPRVAVRSPEQVVEPAQRARGSVRVDGDVGQPLVDVLTLDELLLRPRPQEYPRQCQPELFDLSGERLRGSAQLAALDRNLGQRPAAARLLPAHLQQLRAMLEWMPA